MPNTCNVNNENGKENETSTNCSYRQVMKDIVSNLEEFKKRVAVTSNIAAADETIPTFTPGSVNSTTIKNYTCGLSHLDKFAAAHTRASSHASYDRTSYQSTSSASRQPNKCSSNSSDVFAIKHQFCIDGSNPSGERKTPLFLGPEYSELSNVNNFRLTTVYTDKRAEGSAFNSSDAGILITNATTKSSREQLPYEGSSSDISDVFQMYEKRKPISDNYDDDSDYEYDDIRKVIAPLSKKSSKFAFGKRTHGTSKSHGNKSSNIENDDNQVIVAISEKINEKEHGSEIGFAVIDPRRPYLRLCQMTDTATYVNSIRKINVFNPVELLVPDSFIQYGQPVELLRTLHSQFPNIINTCVQERYFSSRAGKISVANVCLPEYASVNIIIASKHRALAAAAALFEYVGYSQNISFFPGSIRVDFETMEDVMFIDYLTVAKLGLVHPIRTNRLMRKRTLLGILSKCVTVAGRKKLRSQILQPFTDVNVINARLDCVQELVIKNNFLTRLKQSLTKCWDVEHLLSLCVRIQNIQNSKATVRFLDYALLLKTVLDQVPNIRKVLESASHPFFKKCYEDLDDVRFKIIIKRILEVMNEDAEKSRHFAITQYHRCYSVKVNVDDKLDMARLVLTDLVKDFHVNVQKLATKYNLPLEVRVCGSVGYQCQMRLTKLGRLFHQSEMPAEFTKITVSTSMIATMMTTDLTILNEQIKKVLHEINIIAGRIVRSLLDSVREYVGCIYGLCDTIAELDVLVSLARVSSNNNYVRPTFGPLMYLKNSRHPVLDVIPDMNCVPNDVYCTKERNFIIITGPNASGKTVYIRQVILLQVMAQIGCYVPADFAIFRISDHLFARIGFSDKLRFEISAMAKEMAEFKYIFNTMTQNSLIVIDEMCRATTVEEGTGIAWAVSELLLRSSAFVFMTTHYLYLTKLQGLYTNVTNFYLETIPVETDGRLVTLKYTYRLLVGVTRTDHYGVNMIRLLNFPENTHNQAIEILETMSHFWKQQECYQMNLPIERRIDDSIITLAEMLTNELNEEQLPPNLKAITNSIEQFRNECTELAFIYLKEKSNKHQDNVIVCTPSDCLDKSAQCDYSNCEIIVSNQNEKVDRSVGTYSENKTIDRDEQTLTTELDEEQMSLNLKASDDSIEQFRNECNELAFLYSTEKSNKHQDNVVIRSYSDKSTECDYSDCEIIVSNQNEKVDRSVGTYSENKTIDRDEQTLTTELDEEQMPVNLKASDDSIEQFRNECNELAFLYSTENSNKHQDNVIRSYLDKCTERDYSDCEMIVSNQNEKVDRSVGAYSENKTIDRDEQTLTTELDEEQMPVNLNASDDSIEQFRNECNELAFLYSTEKSNKHQDNVIRSYLDKSTERDYSDCEMIVNNQNEKVDRSVGTYSENKTIDRDEQTLTTEFDEEQMSLNLNASDDSIEQFRNECNELAFLYSTEKSNKHQDNVVIRSYSDKSTECDYSDCEIIVSNQNEKVDRSVGTYSENKTIDRDEQTLTTELDEEQMPVNLKASDDSIEQFRNECNELAFLYSTENSNKHQDNVIRSYLDKCTERDYSDCEMIVSNQNEKVDRSVGAYSENKTIDRDEQTLTTELDEEQMPVNLNASDDSIEQFRNEFNELAFLYSTEKSNKHQDNVIRSYLDKSTERDYSDCEMIVNNQNEKGDRSVGTYSENKPIDRDERTLTTEVDEEQTPLNLKASDDSIEELCKEMFFLYLKEKSNKHAHNVNFCSRPDCSDECARRNYSNIIVNKQNEESDRSVGYYSENKTVDRDEQFANYRVGLNIDGGSLKGCNLRIYKNDCISSTFKEATVISNSVNGPLRTSLSTKKYEKPEENRRDNSPSSLQMRNCENYNSFKQPVRVNRSRNESDVVLNKSPIIAARKNLQDLLRGPSGSDKNLTLKIRINEQLAEKKNRSRISVNNLISKKQIFEIDDCENHSTRHVNKRHRDENSENEPPLNDVITNRSNRSDNFSSMSIVAKSKRHFADENRRPGLRDNYRAVSEDRISKGKVTELFERNSGDDSNGRHNNSPSNVSSVVRAENFRTSKHFEAKKNRQQLDSRNGNNGSVFKGSTERNNRISSSTKQTARKDNSTGFGRFKIDDWLVKLNGLDKLRRKRRAISDDDNLDRAARIESSPVRDNNLSLVENISSVRDKPTSALNTSERSRYLNEENDQNSRSSSRVIKSRDNDMLAMLSVINSRTDLNVENTSNYDDDNRNLIVFKNWNRTIRFEDNDDYGSNVLVHSNYTANTVITNFNNNIVDNTVDNLSRKFILVNDNFNADPRALIRDRESELVPILNNSTFALAKRSNDIADYNDAMRIPTRNNEYSNVASLFANKRKKHALVDYPFGSSDEDSGDASVISKPKKRRIDKSPPSISSNVDIMRTPASRVSQSSVVTSIDSNCSHILEHARSVCRIVEGETK